MFSGALPCRRHRHRIGLAPSDPVRFGARVGWRGLLLAWPLGSQIGPFRRLRSPRHPPTSVPFPLGSASLTSHRDSTCRRRQSNASRCSTGSMTMAATSVRPSTSAPLYEGRDRGSLTAPPRSRRRRNGRVEDRQGRPGVPPHTRRLTRLHPARKPRAAHCAGAHHLMRR